MRVKIYQIDFERDKRRAKFLSMEGLEKFTGSSKVDPNIYQEVFSGELDPVGLEEIYIRFNQEGHPLHRGHSMSVSDVVVIDPDSVPFLVGEISGSYPGGARFTASAVMFPRRASPERSGIWRRSWAVNCCFDPTRE